MYQKPTSSNPRFSFYYLHSYVWCIEWCAAFHTTLLPLLNKMSSMSHPEHTVISLSYLIAFIVTWHTHTHTHTHTQRARYCAVFRSEYLHRGCALTTTSTASRNVHHWLKTNDYRKLFFFSPRFFSFSFMKSPTWHWDKQTITFNYWQFMVGGGGEKKWKKKNATRGKQIGWHFGRQSSIKRLMAPITTDVGWVDLCFLCKACFWFLIFFPPIVSLQWLTAMSFQRLWESSN